MAETTNEKIGRMDERIKALENSLSKIEARLWWAVAGMLASVGKVAFDIFTKGGLP